MVSQVRHVGREQSAGIASGRGLGVVEHLFQCDGQGVLIAQLHVAHGIPDQDDVHAGVIEETGGRSVVGGKGRDLFAPFFHLQERGGGDFDHACRF